MEATHLTLADAQHIVALDLAGIQRLNAVRVALGTGIFVTCLTLARLRLDRYMRQPRNPRHRRAVIWAFMTANIVPVRYAVRVGYDAFVTALHNLWHSGARANSTVQPADFWVIYRRHLNNVVLPMLADLDLEEILWPDYLFNIFFDVGVVREEAE